jgi:hypothetical protein
MKCDRLILVWFAAAVVGCGGSSANQAAKGTAVDVTGAGAGPVDTAATQTWPTSAPSDIPPFPGTVRTVMTGRLAGNGYGVRIFFEDVRFDQFEAYLASLVAAGFVTQGIVYTTDTPGVSSNAEARAAAHQYDAVRATKGTRTILITVPTQGEVTFDLDGLTAAENTAMDTLPWPAAWTSVLPQPAGCTLRARMGIVVATDTDLWVNCSFADSPTRAQAMVDYLSTLRSLGYTTVSQGTTSADLCGASACVTVQSDLGSIQATKMTPSSNGWPASWADSVPAPEGCVLAKQPSQLKPTSFTVSCTYPDDDATHHQAVALAYETKLQAAGFQVAGPGALGDPMVTLAKGTMTVSLQVEAPRNTMNIGIWQSN